MSDQQLLWPSNSLLTALLADITNPLTHRLPADGGCQYVATFVGL